MVDPDGREVGETGRIRERETIIRTYYMKKIHFSFKKKIGGKEDREGIDNVYKLSSTEVLNYNTVRYCSM